MSQESSKVWMSIIFIFQTEQCLPSTCLMPRLRLEAGCSFMTAHHGEWQVLGWEFDHLSLGLKTRHWLKVKSCMSLLSFWILTCQVHRICSHQRQHKKCHNGEYFHMEFKGQIWLCALVTPIFKLAQLVIQQNTLRWPIKYMQEHITGRSPGVILLFILQLLRMMIKWL